MNDNGTPRIDGVKLTPEATALHIKNIYEDIKRLADSLEGDYVTKAEFSPVKAIAYGLVGILMIGVVSGLLSTVIKTAAAAIIGQ